MKIFKMTLGLIICLSLQAQTEREAQTIVLDAMAEQNLGIQTVVADYRDFENTLFAIGRIEEIPANRSVVSTRVAGRVISLNVYEGDHVEAGEEILTVESRQLGDPPPSVQLKAPQGGLVVATHVRLGQPVAPDAELMDIVDRSKMWAVAQVPENAAAHLQIGTRARIKVPASGESPIEATLSRFGVVADARSGTVEAIFELDNPDGRLRPGLRAEFALILDHRRDVLAVPREALQGDPARRVVFVKDFDLPHAFVRAPVVVGAQNDRYVEIESGLFPGDEVVTDGSYLLSFAGPGTGLSLKEALDAAHGHAHNEDGSEMTAEQKAARQDVSSDAHAGHGHGDEEHLPTWLLIYAGVVSMLALILAQYLWNSKRMETESSDA